jgi:hypothetical protein
LSPCLLIPLSPCFDEQAQQLGKRLLTLADHGHVDRRVAQHPVVVALDLGAADDDQQAGQVRLDALGNPQAALAVPGVQRDAQHLGRPRDDRVDQERVAGMVGQVARQEVDRDAIEQPLGVSIRLQVARRERDVRIGIVGDRQLHQQHGKASHEANVPIQ